MKNIRLIFIYLKESVLPIICVLMIAATTDMVLLASSELKRSIPDILYLNILIAAIVLVLACAGFLRFKARYIKLLNALDKKEYTDYSLPSENSFFGSLLLAVATVKNEECSNRIKALQNSLDELNEYITRWVHEIKTPVAVCELIADNATSAEASSRSLKIELERTRFLINQVLYAARASRYDRDLAVSEFNLAKSVIDSIKRNSVFFIHKNIEVVKSSLDFNVINDEKWVSYILDQILNNAGKYTNQNGRLEIHAQEDEKRVMLHIRDNGIGIAGHDLGRIFDKGFTGENVRMMTRSTGMGLYYSKTMADKLGIGLEVCSELGSFTEFTLVFSKINDMLRF